MLARQGIAIGAGCSGRPSRPGRGTLPQSDIDIPPHRLEAIDTIRNAGNHLLTVINDTLDLSKIEAGKMTVERVEMSLCNLLRETNSFMRPRAGAKGLELRIALESKVPELVIGASTRVRQIILDLAGNAVKFTDAGWVRLTCRVQPGEGDQRRLHSDVEDTAPGLTAEQTRGLFQAFSQADTTVTLKHGGTGLRLAICRRLAQLMGGSVTLLSTSAGEGSCFRVDLPLHAVANPAWTDRLDAGCNDYASKPIDKAAMLAMCAKWIGPAHGARQRSVTASGQPVNFIETRRHEPTPSPAFKIGGLLRLRIEEIVSPTREGSPRSRSRLGRPSLNQR